MPVASDPHSAFSYVLTCDRRLPHAQRTVFLLRSLTPAELDSVEAFMRPTGTAPASWIVDVAVLRIALVGWRRLRDSRGDEVAFRSDSVRLSSGVVRPEVSEESLSRLAPEWRRELAGVVLDHSRRGDARALEAEHVSAEFVDALIPLPPGTDSPRRWVTVGLPPDPAVAGPNRKGSWVSGSSRPDCVGSVDAAVSRLASDLSPASTARPLRTKPRPLRNEESWSPLVAALQRRLTALSAEAPTGIAGADSRSETIDPSALERESSG